MTDERFADAQRIAELQRTIAWQDADTTLLLDALNAANECARTARIAANASEHLAHFILEYGANHPVGSHEARHILRLAATARTAVAEMQEADALATTGTPEAREGETT